MLVKYEDLELDVIQSNEHEWLLSTELVAKGYGTSIDSILKHLQRKKDELIVNKHYLRGVDNLSTQKDQVFWTKRGVIRLGFFIRSAAAAKFRDFAEDLIIDRMESAEVSEADAIIDTVRYVLSLSASNSVKADIIKRINQPEARALPAGTQIELSPAIDEDNRPRSSATKLLRFYRAPIDVIEFNTRMLSIGYLQRKQSSGWKMYNVLVNEGVQYGCNVQNRFYPQQTTPMYYTDAFEDLLNIILCLDE